MTSVSQPPREPRPRRTALMPGRRPPINFTALDAAQSEAAPQIIVAESFDTETRINAIKFNLLLQHPDLKILLDLSDKRYEAALKTLVAFQKIIATDLQKIKAARQEIRTYNAHYFDTTQAEARATLQEKFNFIINELTTALRREERIKNTDETKEARPNQVTLDYTVPQRKGEDKTRPRRETITLSEQDHQLMINIIKGASGPK